MARENRFDKRDFKGKWINQNISFLAWFRVNNLNGNEQIKNPKKKNKKSKFF